MSLAGASVVVVGLGVSGAAAATALLDAGARVTVVDAGSSAQSCRRASALTGRGAEVTLSASVDAMISAAAAADLVVPSPGVPEGGPLLAPVLVRGVPVISEPELAWRLSGGRTRLVAVTGTNGKTTTTELLAACLGAPAAGNIGTPLVSLLAAAEPPPLVVAELSSFQLRFADTLRPEVGVLLNLAPDHLDWHADLAGYAAAKARVWAAQRAGDTAVLSADDPGARRVAADHPPPGRVVTFTTAAPHEGQVGVADGAVTAAADGRRLRLVELADLALTGPHNLANVAAAAAAALAAGAGADTLAAPLASYRPGRHRLEWVATLAGVDYVDDSKATNPHAAAAALASFGSVVWIAGGLAKGLSFESLRPAVAGSVRAAVTIGTSGPQLASLVRELGRPVVEAGALPAAVAAAAELAQPGDTVLLAPACASMDQFSDYAERGRVFRAAVSELAASPPAVAPAPARGGGRGR